MRGTTREVYLTRFRLYNYVFLFIFVSLFVTHIHLWLQAS